MILKALLYLEKDDLENIYVGVYDWTVFRRRRMQKAWRLAMKVMTAQGEINITPWDALLLEVRRSAYRTTWVDMRLDEYLQRERELQHEGEESDRAAADVQVRRWLAQSRYERNHLARVSKASIDAGIAATLVHQVELEAGEIVRVLTIGLDALELSHEERLMATKAMRDELEQISTQRFRAVTAG